MGCDHVLRMSMTHKNAKYMSFGFCSSNIVRYGTVGTYSLKKYSTFEFEKLIRILLIYALRAYVKKT